MLRFAFVLLFCPLILLSQETVILDHDWNEFGLTAQTTPDEGLIVYGYQDSLGFLQTFFTKLDANNQEEWHINSESFSIGNFIDTKTKLAKTNNGNILFVGGTDNNIILYKLSPDGDFLIQKEFNFSNVQTASKIFPFEDHFIILGLTTFSDGKENILLLEVTEDGELLDTHQINLEEWTDWIWPTSISQHPINKDYYILWNNRNDPKGTRITRLNELFEVVWTKSLDVNYQNLGLELELFNNGDLALLGEVNGNFVFILDENGDIKTKTFSYFDEKSFSASMVNTGQSVLVAGGTVEPEDLDLEFGFFLFEVDVEGNILTDTMYDARENAFFDILPLTDNQYLLTGNKHNGNFPASANTQDVYLEFYQHGILNSTSSPNAFHTLPVFPNPTEGNINLKLIQGIEKMHIYNPSGIAIFQYEQMIPKEIDLRQLPNGTYIIKIWSKDGSEVIQVVKI